MRRTPRPFPRFRSLTAFVFAVLCTVLAVEQARAQNAVLGFRDRFNGAPLTWGGGASYIMRPTGGADGASDGYLEISTIGGPSSLASRTFEPEYTGDWTAAGITQIRLWLNDVGTAQPLQLHVDLGGTSNRWLYTQTFLPPHNAWAEFVVDLTNPASFTQIINTPGSTFAGALHDVQVLQIRHDIAPFIQNPNAIEGDFGVDNILLTNGLVGVEDRPSTVRRALELDAPYPNPSRGAVSFSVQQHAAEPLEVTIVDVTGRRVRGETLAAGGTGPRVWMWDGRDDRGARVAPGAYRVIMRDSAGGVSRPLVRID